MKKRAYWLANIESALKERSILWLSGVRRVGKTVLCKSINAEYFDCELPRIRRAIEDPEAFLNSFRGKRIILDEVHRLKNPSELLKIASDHYPETKIIATGSSTLQASTKFRDTLTGRKKELWLTPMISADLKDFGNLDLKHRLLHGGLPPFFLNKKLPEADFQEWMDSYWAKDIQELFRLEKHYSFTRFVELVFANSGGIFEATKYTAPCEASRTTISNYLNVLEKTFVAYIIRPFSSRRATEIVSAPKIYAFDSGFVCYYKGWHQLRAEDLGFLWEHYVLNEIYGQTQQRNIFYWRDKQGHEIDFIWIKPGQLPIVVECKWSANNFDPSNIKIFRKRYPKGRNFVIAQDVDKPFSRSYAGLRIDFVNLLEFIKFITLGKR